MGPPLPRDPEYLRTDLLRSNDAPARFITVDVWTSRESCLAFRDRFIDEFEALDRACEVMTRRETHIGDFSLVS